MKFNPIEVLGEVKRRSSHDALIERVKEHAGHCTDADDLDELIGNVAAMVADEIHCELAATLEDVCRA